MQDTQTIYGAQRATLDLIQGLLEHPREVNVHTILIEETRLGAKDSRLREALHMIGCPFHVVPVGQAFSPKLVSEVRKMLKILDADILHTVGPKADCHGMVASRWTFDIPIVATVHGWLFRRDIKERFHEALDSLSLKHVDQVIVLSNFYYDMLKSKGVNPERLALIPSGLHPSEIPSDEEIEAPREKHKPFTIGMMGRLSSEKNHTLLLQAAEGLKHEHEHFRLLIAGDGPDRLAVEEEIKQRKLKKQTLLTGYVDKDMFLKEIDALALCSKIENLPYVLMEAMSWARPVVGTNVGGIPEMIEDGRNGYLVELDDVDALADRFKRWIDDPEAARRMGLEGRKKLQQDFHLETTVQRHIDLYQQVIQAK